MSHIVNTINKLKEELNPSQVELVAVSKTKPMEAIQEAYDGGQRVFGENKVQEMVDKHEQLPKDIEWHMIGHLQSNKVKYMASFVHLIHAVDSEKLLKEIDKQAAKHDRVINCLLQLKIAQEDSKFGMSFEEALDLMDQLENYPNVQVAGLMGMATFTEDKDVVRDEFRRLKQYFDRMNSFGDYGLKTLSMGMSGDYSLAIEEGSNMVRIGSTIFGARNYA